LILASDDTQVLLVWAESHGDDLVLVTTLVLHKFDLDCSIFHLLPGLRVIHLNLIIIRDKNAVHLQDVDTYLTFIVIVSNIDPEVMRKLPCIDIEILLIGFESNTIFDGRPKHHLRALHKVIHTVFEFRHIV